MVREPGNRRSWRLQGLVDEYLVVRGAELSQEERKRKVAAAPVLWRMRGQLSDLSIEQTLVEIHESLGRQPVSLLSVFDRTSWMEHVWTDLEEAFRSERLVLLRSPPPAYQVAMIVPKEEEPWEDESEPTTWVGLELKDEEGNPVSGQRVRILLPNGSSRESVSDDRGKIRMEGIPPGNCKVEFIGIDAADWRAA